MNTPSPVPLSISPIAQSEAWGKLAEMGCDSLRVYVQGGGCSGFTYGFAVERREEVQADDLVLDVHAGDGQDFALVVDSMSASYLDGATIDYKDELFQRSFVINNPNAVHTCGCGSSFSV